MKSIALAISAVALLLAGVIVWKEQSGVQNGERVSREAPLSLWHPAKAASES